MATRYTVDQLRALEPHPLSQLLPPMAAQSLSALVDDIRANGQRSAIVLYEGKVLDGRHRRFALLELNQPGTVTDFPGSADDARRYVISANIARRQLTTSQAAMVAARLVSTRQGARAGTGDITQSAAATTVGVSLRYVRDAQWLIEHDEALADKVFDGSLSLAAAIRRARPSRARRVEPAPQIDPHPPIEHVAAVAGDARPILIAAIEAMATTDAGEWVNTLPESARRALVIRLDAFARTAYDVAEESGMLRS